MCYGCWEDAGSPQIVNDNTLAAAKLITELYEHNGVGGNLHIITDDYNVDSGNVAFCREWLASHGCDEDREQNAIEEKLLDLLEPMSEDERMSAVALHWEHFEAPEVAA